MANAVPGAVLVAEAGTRPAGVEPRWQRSQAVDDGMWAFGPMGVVGGIPTMRLMPAKLRVEPDGAWQATQLLVMPVWLINEPLNLAPLGTGVVATLEPVPTWQASQPVVMGMWLLGGPMMVKLAAGMAKDKDKDKDNAASAAAAIFMFGLQTISDRL